MTSVIHAKGHISDPRGGMQHTRPSQSTHAGYCQLVDEYVPTTDALVMTFFLLRYSTFFMISKSHFNSVILSHALHLEILKQNEVSVKITAH